MHTRKTRYKSSSCCTRASKLYTHYIYVISHRAIKNHKQPYRSYTCVYIIESLHVQRACECTRAHNIYTYIYEIKTNNRSLSYSCISQRNSFDSTNNNIIIKNDVSRITPRRNTCSVLSNTRTATYINHSIYTTSRFLAPLLALCACRLQRFRLHI